MDGKSVDIRWEAALSFAANVLILGIEFAIIVLLARELGASGVGTYFFIITLALVLNRPTSAIAATMEKRASEVNTNVGQYLGLSIGVAVLYLLVILGVGYAMTLGLTSPYVDLTVPQYVAFVSIVLGRSIYGLARRLYKAVGHPGAAMWVNVVRDLLFLPSFLVVIRVGGGALSVVATRAAILLTVALCVFGWLQVAPRKPTRSVLKRTYKYARWHFPSLLTSTLLGRLPVLLLGTFVGSSAVGIYQAAYRLTEFGPYVGTCVKEPLLIKMSGVTSDNLNPRPHVRKAMSYTPIIAIPVLATALTAPDLILRTVYGEQFAGASLVLVIIALGELMYAQSRTGKAALNGSDNPAYSFAANVTALAVSIPTAILVLPELGALGGAVLFLVSESVILVVVFFAGYTTFSDAIFGGRFLGVAAVGGVLYGGVFKAFVSMGVVSGLPTLAITVAASGAVYVGALAVGSGSFRTGVVQTLREVHCRTRAFLGVG